MLSNVLLFQSPIPPPALLQALYLCQEKSTDNLQINEVSAQMPAKAMKVHITEMRLLHAGQVQGLTVSCVNHKRSHTHIDRNRDARTTVPAATDRLSKCRATDSKRWKLDRWACVVVSVCLFCLPQQTHTARRQNRRRRTQPAHNRGGATKARQQKHTNKTTTQHEKTNTETVLAVPKRRSMWHEPSWVPQGGVGLDRPLRFAEQPDAERRLAEEAPLFGPTNGSGGCGSSSRSAFGAAKHRGVPGAFSLIETLVFGEIGSSAWFDTSTIGRAWDAFRAVCALVAMEPPPRQRGPCCANGFRPSPCGRRAPDEVQGARVGVACARLGLPPPGGSLPREVPSERPPTRQTDGSPGWPGAVHDSPRVEQQGTADPKDSSACLYPCLCIFFPSLSASFVCVCPRVTRPWVSLGCFCPPWRPHPITAPGGEKQSGSGQWPRFARMRTRSGQERRAAAFACATAALASLSAMSSPRTPSSRRHARTL